MSEPDLPKYLVLDDYETGGIWFIVEARDEDEIHAVLPTVRVYPLGERPTWISDEMLKEIENQRTFRIDALPSSAWMNRLRSEHLSPCDACYREVVGGSPEPARQPAIRLKPRSKRWNHRRTPPPR
jgi:hypothetical protein